MPYYKDEKNNLYSLDSSEFEHMLLSGCVQITDQEYQALLASKVPVPTNQELSSELDDLVASIYNRWTRFEAEYVLRESQAQTYKDAGYAGEVPRQVAAFADRAGVPYQQATDLILSQAAGLRTALDNLGDLRMRKYEILNAADAETAQAKFDEISAEINAIGDSLS